jgi:polyisoprenoid-binding protein YceI
MSYGKLHLAAGVAALALALAVTLCAAPAHAAETFKVDPNHSEVSFQIRHLLTQVRGGFNDFGGTVVMDPSDPAASSVDFWIDAGSIDTRNDQRDQHLRSEDFFYVEQNPRITFESSAVQKTGENTYDVTGTLTLRGVSKRVTLPVTFAGTAPDPWGNVRAGFSTSTTVDRKEYGIHWNQALDQGGFLLGDDVAISINLEAVQQKEEKQVAGR